MKKILLNFAFSCMHSITILARRLGVFAKKGGAPLRSVALAAYHFIAWIYGFFVKFRLYYSAQKKDAEHLLATPVVEYGLLVCVVLFIGVSVLFTQLFMQESHDDVFKPSAVLARFVLPKEEVSIAVPENTQEDLALEPEYTPDTDAIRTPTALDSQNDTSQQAPFPDELALNPDAILKPIIPTGETLKGPEARIQTYIVKQGDTISAIATLFGLNASTLLWANNLYENTIIRQGQSLTIPPVNGIVYTVKKGDTLARIALSFNSEVEKIIQTNRLANADTISIGQALIIPGARPNSTIPPRQSPTLLARLRNLIIPKQQKRVGAGISAFTRFIWPTSARRITQYFTWRHGGVDIAGPPSNRIYAAADGRVTLSGWQRGYGFTVLIDHGNGYVTRYAHSRKLLVSPGKYVQKGDTIAMVGSTGRSTGPHLHFEVYRNGRKVNPLSYVR